MAIYIINTSAMEAFLVRCTNEALSKGHIRKAFPAGRKE